ncbi:zinc knuckle containing protein [Beauveria bassiana ARSEF 2860]|uniref:Zinc knuckle containing protein n=1 Tax=Beauveria bassiana (strain ARSEF 2860) TaxID=655819 RepID=J4UM15_BEAB2|nr:zinc knuckle containing protein [Beauveria bassiana ARSEF 2860]EJP65747.1 zinc knuckle containing protein [Beauveria bassiana ARSEF 2860]
MSITDPQHMPPRCCSQEHIPLRYVGQLFDEDFKKTWNRKFDEYTTRNRLYCPSRKCGEWIMPDSIRRENGRKVARCERCKTKELRDRVVARNMQNDVRYEMSGALGDMTSFGNTAGHHMNESYRRDHAPLPSRPPSSFDRAAGYLSDVNRARGGYGPSFLERQGSTRSRSGRQPSTAHDDLPLRRDSYGRRPSVDERDYRREPQRSRSERVIPARTSRRYEDEAAVHAPNRGRRASAEPPRGSALAGLNGKDRGMGRVAEWRSYVEMGVPDGESVVGHA